MWIVEDSLDTPMQPAVTFGTIGGNDHTWTDGAQKVHPLTLNLYLPVADDGCLERNMWGCDFRVVLCGRRVKGPHVVDNPDATAPDPKEYCRSDPGVMMKPSEWQRIDSEDDDLDVLDNR